MKKLIQIIGAGLLSLTAASLQAEGEKTIIVNYPGNFWDTIEDTGFYLTRISARPGKQKTYLSLRKIPTKMYEGFNEVYIDENNDGTLDSYEIKILKMDYGQVIESKSVLRKDNQITPDDQKSYNAHLTTIYEIKKQQNKENN